MRETPPRPRRAAPPDPAELHARVIAAARRCFMRHGVARTTMADVALEAGMTRAALYRTVPSASELVELVIVARVAEIGDGLRATLADTTAGPTEAILQTCLVAVDGAREDAELQNFFTTSTTLRVHQLMTGDFPQVATIVLDLFRPAFAAARAAGELRTDVDDAALAEWLRGVMLMLILREDLDHAAEEAMLRSFLLPALRPGPAVG